MVDWAQEVRESQERERLNKEARAKGITQYWYYTTEDYCPVCGRSDRSRERMYTEKPKEIYHRFKMREVYDWCDG